MSMSSTTEVGIVTLIIKFPTPQLHSANPYIERSLCIYIVYVRQRSHQIT